VPTSQREIPLPRLLRRWDLGEPYEVTPLTERTRRVASGTARFLLEEFNDVEPRRQILFRHRVLDALADAGLPVPAAIPARNGRSLVTADGHRYALYPWVDGQRRAGLELSLTQCHELGELLGLVHAELDALTPPVQQTLLLPTSRAVDAVAEIDDLIGALPRHGDDCPARRPRTALVVHGQDRARRQDCALAGRRLRERRAMLTELSDHQPPEIDTAMVGYVHGDFHAQNLLYGRTRRVTAIVGWGRLSIAPYGGELVRAAVLLFGHDDERGLDLERVESFVRGHAAAFPLDTAQIQSAVHRLWWERLCDVTALRRRYLDHDHQFTGAVALLAWWTEHLDRTLDVFAAPYTAPSERA
jgi:Ser/Thr protein kinase RdoA (MazF antagonist)